MFFRRKRGLVVKNAKSVRPSDPLDGFRRRSSGETGKYQIRGEVWKSVRKLLLLALALALVYFVRECWLAWNIFQ